MKRISRVFLQILFFIPLLVSLIFVFLVLIINSLRFCCSRKRKLKQYRIILSKKRKSIDSYQFKKEEFLALPPKQLEELKLSTNVNTNIEYDYFTVEEMMNPNNYSSQDFDAEVFLTEYEEFTNTKGKKPPEKFFVYFGKSFWCGAFAKMLFRSEITSYYKLAGHLQYHGVYSIKNPTKYKWFCVELASEFTSKDSFKSDVVLSKLPFYRKIGYFMLSFSTICAHGLDFSLCEEYTELSFFKQIFAIFPGAGNNAIFVEKQKQDPY